MGCGCNGRRSALTSSTGKWYVITVTGEEKGDYLTATEARIAAQAAGGGIVKQRKS